MKILFCNLNSLPPYHQSGAEITIDEFLEELSENGHLVYSVICNEIPLLRMGEFNRVIQDGYDQVDYPYLKIFLNSKDNFQSKAIHIINEIRPDVIISQLNFLKPLYEYCESRNIPLFYLIHGIHQTGGMHSDGELAILKSQVVKGIICMSNFIKKSLQSNLKEKAVVIYPRIPYSRYKAKKLFRDRILFFNPIKSKGIDIVLQLAKMFPDEMFEIKETWKHSTICASERALLGKNVVIGKIECSNSDIYKHCKLLLIPSQEVEGYGRGIIEANINKIPIIASNIGGIPEAAGVKQYLIDDYRSLEAWQYWLEKILRANVYSKKCVDALNNSLLASERYSKRTFSGYIEQMLG